MTNSSRPERPGRPHGPRRSGRGRPGRAQAPRGERGGHQRSRRPAPERRAPRDAAPSPRRAAFDVLSAVTHSDAYANLLLPPLLREREIFGRDAAFATELTYGTLRLQGRYDAIIEAASGRAVADLDVAVQVALRLGAHQLLGMRVPPHAAVSETVALARREISAGPAQLVNAVLRRVSEKTLPEWLEQISPGSTDIDLARRHSHPEWIVRAFRQGLSAPSTQAEDELVQLLEANNTPPAVQLVARPGVTTDDDLAGLRLDPGRYAPTAHYLHSGDPGQLRGLRAGRLGVQDEGSQLVTLATFAAPVDGPDSTWLDVCAGPGGKAALAAALLAERGGGTLVANELHQHRTDLVQSNVQAIPDSVTIDLRTGDGREVGTYEPGAYDRVLVDAPCTGLGALRRRPESRWRRQPSDLPALTALQRDLLTSALRSVRVGGVVGYITCSPHVAETTLVVKDVVRALAKDGLEVETLDAAAIGADVSRQGDLGGVGPYLQLWPHRHGTDAMFLALLRRKA